MIEYLGHKLISSPAPNYPNDLVCEICKLRLEPLDCHGEYIQYRSIIKYKPDVSAGEEDNTNYNLTCEEQQIKNLLE